MPSAILVAALEGAIALPEVRDIAMRVSNDLDFDMAWALKVFLQVHGVIAKRSLGFGLGGADRVFEIGFGLGEFHAATAAASRGFHQDREADLLGGLLGLGNRRQGAFRAGDTGHASFDHRGLGRDLVAHDADMLGRGANEGQPMRFDHFGELGILGQEAIARMDRVGAGDLGGSQDLRLLQIAFGGWRRPDADAFVCEAPYSTGWESETYISFTMPALSASTGLNVFIASTRRTVSPFFTLSPTATNCFAPGSGDR